MLRWLVIIFVLLSAGAFSWGVQLVRFFDAFQFIIVTQSIFSAGILVRLNRGMPTLDWKGADPTQRKNLTTAVLGLAREYVAILAINIFTIVVLIALIVVGKEEIRAEWAVWTQRACAGLIGALLALCIARMAYVIWRDYDIVRLQKALIDAAAQKDEVATQTEAADRKVSEIRSAGLRNTGTGGPRQWQDKDF